MKRLYQSGIFYPEGDELREMTKIEKSKNLSRVIIVPHMDLRRCYKEIANAFSILNESKNYIILCPIHKGRVKEDEEEFLFEGEVLPSSCMVNLGLKKREYYAEEEAGAEIIVPFIMNNYPKSTFSIIYSDIISAEESKKLSEYLRSVDTNDTSYIISSNLTKLCKDSNEMKIEKEKTLLSLTSSCPLWKEKNEKKISFCGLGIVDAFDRLFSRGWKVLNSINEENYTGHGTLYK